MASSSSASEAFKNNIFLLLIIVDPFELLYVNLEMCVWLVPPGSSTFSQIHCWPLYAYRTSKVRAWRSRHCSVSSCDLGAFAFFYELFCELITGVVKNKQCTIYNLSLLCSPPRPVGWNNRGINFSPLKVCRPLGCFHLLSSASAGRADTDGAFPSCASVCLSL